jgi:methionyl aminopeptidase
MGGDTRGRNDPCWCGSGKKYKKCHLGQEMGSQRQVSSPWIKDAKAIACMRRSGLFNAQLMDYISTYVKPGISTEKLDDLVRTYTYDHGHIPACLGYKKFPKSCCISVNEVVCHGIPNPHVILKEGDIVNIDLTTIVEGYFADQSETFLIGQVTDTARRLTAASANAMILGIRTVRPGESFATIGEVIEAYVHAQGFSVVVDYTGHGIGTAFHEDPPIYHFRNTELKKYIMSPGMIFTIEPMVNEGVWQVDVDPVDRWTVRTKDRKLSAQFEHTILVTEKGFEILTLTPSLLQAGVISHLATIPERAL